MSMELTKRLWEQPTDKGVLAYHIIQSFSPGEATPDQVHKIGCEFARRFLADRFECTVSTHLDKGHLHNHIVVNSVSYADGKMFRTRGKNPLDIDPRPSVRATIMALKKAARTASQAQEKVQNIIAEEER